MSKFNVKAVLLYVCPQSAENNNVVKLAAETVGTVTVTSGALTTLTGTGTQFKYKDVDGDGLGQLTVGAYVYKSGSVMVGKVTAITSQTSATITNPDSLTFTGASYYVDMGPDNVVATLNLNYAPESTTEEYTYTGDELDRTAYTDETDYYSKFDFETLLPCLSSIASNNPTQAEMPLASLFNSSGFATVLSTNNTYTGTYTNSLPSTTLLSVQIRKSSQDQSRQKTYTLYNARGTVDFDGLTGKKAKIKWNYVGEFQHIADRVRITPNPDILVKQQSALAANASALNIITSQLGVWGGEFNTDEPAAVSGIKNVCFDKLTAPNLNGFNYNRYQLGCGNGWSKTAVPTDVTLTIAEDSADADYNPDAYRTKDHKLFYEFSQGAELNSKVSITFDRMQLTKVTPSTVADFAGQDLMFRNKGYVHIDLRADTANASGLGISAKPKYGVGGAIGSTNVKGLAALLTSMTDIPGSTDDGADGTSFNIKSASASQYGWVAIKASAYVDGLVFTTASATEGGWQGAGLPGAYSTPPSASPNTSTVTLSYNGELWLFFRRDVANTVKQVWTISLPA